MDRRPGSRASADKLADVNPYGKVRHTIDRIEGRVEARCEEALFERPAQYVHHGLSIGGSPSPNWH